MGFVSMFTGMVKKIMWSFIKMEANYKITVLVEAFNEAEAEEVLHHGDVDRMSIIGVEKYE